jgi:hypothetical protein
LKHLDPNLYRILTGKHLKDIRYPTPQQQHKKFMREMFTNFPLRSLGFSDQEGEFNLTEEEREHHVHVLGSTGEGKSKFLEMMICQDIKNLHDGKTKSGVCFIDSSDNGATLYKVLKYCAKINFQKVFLIEPADIWSKQFGFVPLLNPLQYDDVPPEAMAAFVMSCIRILWNTKDFSEEASSISTGSGSLRPFTPDEGHYLKSSPS